MRCIHNYLLAPDICAQNAVWTNKMVSLQGGHIGKKCQERYSFDCFIFIVYGLYFAFPPWCKTNRECLLNLETHWLCEELIGKYEADFEFIHTERSLDY